MKIRYPGPFHAVIDVNDHRVWRERGRINIDVDRCGERQRAEVQRCQYKQAASERFDSLHTNLVMIYVTQQTRSVCRTCIYPYEGPAAGLFPPTSRLGDSVH